LVFEEAIAKNPVEPVRKRYLQAYKTQRGHTHQLISVEDAARLVDSMVDIRNKALLMLLFKTGIRVKELCELDLADVDLAGGRITLKPTPKRTNRIAFFDDEAEHLLRRWLKVRAHRVPDTEASLFASHRGRLKKSTVTGLVRQAATCLGLHDQSSPDMERHFSPHSCRHWFTTHLDRAGMKREHIQVLRGDVGREAIDTYIHNEMEKIREEYLVCIPKLYI
jgi:integrase/recombinase XerD